MAEVSVTMTLEVDDECKNVGDMLEQLLGRLEYVVGNEFGDPTIRGREDMDWGADLMGYENAAVRNIEFSDIEGV